MIFLNVWGLHHDESKFPNHDTFDPDHYKGRTLLAAEYANSADYENRDHYDYGMFSPWLCNHTSGFLTDSHITPPII